MDKLLFYFLQDQANPGIEPTWDKKYFKNRDLFSFRRMNKKKRKKTFAWMKSEGCRVCKSNKKLHRHHIQPLQYGGDNNPNNIIVLCHECHEKVHCHEIKKTPPKRNKQAKLVKRKTPMKSKNPRPKRGKYCGHGRVAKWCTQCRYVGVSK